MLLLRPGSNAQGPGAARRDVRFGGYRFSPALMQLTGPGLTAPLTGLPCRILDRLLDARGAVVTRAELKALLWPGCERIDTERRLNTAMRALRQALGDGSAAPAYIETVRGVGYRWIDPGRQPGQAWGLAAAAAASALLVALAAPGQRSLASFPDRAASSQFVALAAQIGVRPEAAPRLRLFAERHPAYAPAALLYADTTVRAWRGDPSPSRLTEARAAITAAERLVGGSPRLALLRADLDMRGDWNFRAAEAGYRRVLAHDPADVDAHRGMAWLLLNTERPTLARAEVDRALAGGPLTVDARADLGWLLIRLRRPDLAATLCQAEAPSLNLLSCRQAAFADLGQWTPAREIALQVMRRLDAAPAAIAGVEAASARDGYDGFLRWRAEAFAKGAGHWFQRAQLRASAGDYQAALDDLDHAFTVRDPDLIKLSTSREFEPMKTDRRFRRLRAALERARPP
jgi:DNA-binding winged helix-turn-helix (wHTH) protein/tetratricopeptide (TPR) repeat protein